MHQSSRVWVWMEFSRDFLFISSTHRNTREFCVGYANACVICSRPYRYFCPKSRSGTRWWNGSTDSTHKNATNRSDNSITTALSTDFIVEGKDKSNALMKINGTNITNKLQLCEYKLYNQRCHWLNANTFKKKILFYTILGYITVCDVYFRSREK